MRSGTEMNEIIFATATELARAIARAETFGRGSPGARGSDHRRQRADQHRGAACAGQRQPSHAQADAEMAQGSLRGPLHGVPFTVKDVFAHGRPGERDQSAHPPTQHGQQDATVVAPAARPGRSCWARPTARPTAAEATPRTRSAGALSTTMIKRAARAGAAAARPRFIRGGRRTVWAGQ